MNKSFYCSFNVLCSSIFHCLVVVVVAAVVVTFVVVVVVARRLVAQHFPAEWWLDISLSRVVC